MVALEQLSIPWLGLIADLYPYIASPLRLAKRGTLHRTEKVHPKNISIIFGFRKLRLAYSPDLVKFTRPVWNDVNAFWYVLRAQIRFPFSVRSPDVGLLIGFIERCKLRKLEHNRSIKLFRV